MLQVIMVGLIEYNVLPVDTRIHVLVLIPSFFIIFDIAWGALRCANRTIISRNSRSKSGNSSSSSKLNSTVSELLRMLGLRVGGSSAVLPGFADASTIDNGHAAATGEQQCSATCDLNASMLSSSLCLMKSTPLNAAFAQYVECALCYESYKFLVDATAYADGVYATTAEQVSTTSGTLLVSVLVNVIIQVSLPALLC
jgi:hypothetical protein